MYEDRTMDDYDGQGLLDKTKALIQKIRKHFKPVVENDLK